MSEQAPITLVSPDGQRYDVPAAGVQQLRAKGFRDLTDSERHDAEMQKKYGEGVLPAVGSALSGAASTLSFGGSDALLAQTPLAEANREVSERNPIAHTVGSVASLAVPVLGELGEVGAGVKAAKLAGSGIEGVSAASHAIGEGATGLAKAVGLERAAPIIGGATQAATEGAAFQVGSNVGEASRRDAPLDAETLLSHVGEGAILGAGVGAALPVANKVAAWTAEKAASGLESGMQGLRALGIGLANAGVDAVAAGAGAAVRNADRIGALAEGVGGKIADTVDEHLMPRIREGLTAQTNRPDIINEVFADGEEGRALRKELGPQTITGTREVQTEALSKPLNEIWKQSRENSPMFDDLALAVKRDTQGFDLQAPLEKAVHRSVVTDVVSQAGKLLTTLEENSPNGAKLFRQAFDDFSKTAKQGQSAHALYRGIDDLKAMAGRLSKLDAKRAAFDSGAGIAATAANDFRGFAQRHLEDTNIWGEAGVIQHEVNAAYTDYTRAKDVFESFFASKKVNGRSLDILDGKKIKIWAKDITGPEGEIRNKVVDDLVSSQNKLIAITERLSQRAQTEARATLGSATAGDAIRARAAAIEGAPEGVADVLNRSRDAINDVAAAKATAAKEVDRAEVLQQTQNAILSRQGAGVNPLPVEMLKGIGGGAFLGHMLGGAPGAVVGGSMASVLQKYGAITTNPKSAIKFLNTIDRLRGIDKERVATWVKETLGKVDELAPRAREAIGKTNESIASKILEARAGASERIAATASKIDEATPGIMRRLLPAVSYADVTNSDAGEWWKKTQKAVVNGQVNPQALNDRLTKDVAGIADSLPDMAKAITQQQLRVFGYLADHIPKNPRPNMLGGGTWTPDEGQMKAYRDLVLVATKPDALLPLITIGTATRAQVDAVRELWPKKFAETQAQVVNAVMTAASDGHPVPYEARLRIGQLLGTPLDPSQEPGFVQWIQAASQPAAQQNQAASQPAADGQNQPINLNFKTDNDLPLSMKSQTAE